MQLRAGAGANVGHGVLVTGLVADVSWCGLYAAKGWSCLEEGRTGA